MKKICQVYTRFDDVEKLDVNFEIIINDFFDIYF